MIQRILLAILLTGTIADSYGQVRVTKEEKAVYSQMTRLISNSETLLGKTIEELSGGNPNSISYNGKKWKTKSTPYDSMGAKEIVLVNMGGGILWLWISKKTDMVFMLSYSLNKIATMKKTIAILHDNYSIDRGKASLAAAQSSGLFSAAIEMDSTNTRILISLVQLTNLPGKPVTVFVQAVEFAGMVTPESSGDTQDPTRSHREEIVKYKQ